jgi:hypothetical protein
MNLDELIVIGIDPGPTTGIVELKWSDDAQAFTRKRIAQCNSPAALAVVAAFILEHDTAPTFLAIEKFVDGRRSGRGNSPVSGRVTRDVIAALTLEYTDYPLTTVELRSASEVKPWANDERLHRVGLWSATKGMTHARDAARHALFAAVKHGVPDPLSKAETFKAVHRGQ